MAMAHVAGARLLCALLLLCVCCASVEVYALLPRFMRDLGLAYEENQEILIQASSVISPSKVVPLRWQDVFPCTKNSGATLPPSHQSIGQVLLGESRVASGMAIKVLRNESCHVLCDTRLSDKDAMALQNRIIGRYRAQLFLDDMPVLNWLPRKKMRLRSRTGLPLGSFLGKTQDGDAFHLYNHFHFVVHYFPSELDTSTFRIVQFSVIPRSRQQVSVQGTSMCTLPEENSVGSATITTIKTAMEGVIFSYGVEWVESETAFNTRWDAYSTTTRRESKVHWMSIINVVSLVLLQSVLLWYLLVRAVRKDISSYNEEDLLGDREDGGWKLVCGDVFRAPRGAVALSVLVGNGVQLLCMLLSSLLLTAVGTVSPGSRGRLVTYLIMLFVLFSTVNGAVTATLIKFFRRRSWQAILLSAVVLPGFFVMVYLTLNFVMLGNHAASTLPFLTLLYLLALWLLVSVPLCFGGAVLGFSTHVQIPVKVNNIPRTIPPQPWYMKGIVSYVALGLVPFTASYVELHFIFSSVWLGASFHMFGLLAVAVVLVVVIVAQIAVFSTYFQLNLLNHHWWWRSFFVSASYGAWLMMYCVFYYLFISMVKGFWGMVLYFGYMGMACVVVAIAFGAVGLLSSFAFVRIVYASVKVE